MGHRHLGLPGSQERLRLLAPTVQSREAWVYSMFNLPLNQHTRRWARGRGGQAACQMGLPNGPDRHGMHVNVFCNAACGMKQASHVLV